MGESLRVLIVEDSEDDAFLLLRALRRSGFEPEWLRVQTAEEMHAALSTREWDAIISDYKLPHFSAPAALKVAQQSGVDVAFIVVSGVMLEETAVEVLKAGAHDYIRKENLSRLPEALRREIRDAHTRAAHKHAEGILRQSEQQHRLILETAMDGFWVVDPATQRLLEVNEQYCSMSGYTRDELLRMTVPQLDAIDTPEDADKRIQQIIRHGGIRFESQHRRKDGSVFDVEISVQLAPEIGRIFAFFRDITERKLAEEKARKSVERLSLALDAAKAGSWEWDPRVDENVWSDEFWKVFGMEPNSITPSYQAWLQLLHSDDRAAVTRAMQEALRKGTEINIEFRLPDHNGATRTLLTRGRPEYSAGGQLERYVGIVLDMTERKLAEEALRDYAHRLVQSQEEERKRLSRDLHDETVQDLVGLAQRAELARADLERSPGTAIRHLEELQALARNMLTRVRRLSNDLRPLILEDLGISAAIQSLCDELSAQKPDCAVLCRIGGTERRLDPDVEITAFRIVQQALNNIRTHAPGATCVNVQLDFLDDGIAASVQDNGPGFVVIPTPVLLRQGHVGLASMQERASLLKGETVITSALAQGTTISLRLPYGK